MCHLGGKVDKWRSVPSPLLPEVWDSFPNIGNSGAQWRPHRGIKGKRIRRSNVEPWQRDQVPGPRGPRISQEYLPVKVWGSKKPLWGSGTDSCSIQDSKTLGSIDPCPQTQTQKSVVPGLASSHTHCLTINITSRERHTCQNKKMFDGHHHFTSKGSSTNSDMCVCVSHTH